MHLRFGLASAFGRKFPASAIAKHFYSTAGDYYATLGIGKSASMPEIKKAYFAVLPFHPDDPFMPALASKAVPPGYEQRSRGIQEVSGGPASL